MKLKCIIMMSGILMVSSMASAQAITEDSINSLINDNKMLSMAMTINDKKIERAKLQNKVAQKNDAVENTAEGSQKAADHNQDVATTLSNDTQNKDKAQDAKKSARDAERSSSKARDAEDDLTSLNNEIEKLRKEIDDREQELISMGGSKYLHPSH